MIASISQGGAAFRDGKIRVGDVLDAVNGQPLQGLDLVEVIVLHVFAHVFFVMAIGLTLLSHAILQIDRFFKSLTTPTVSMRLYRNVSTLLLSNPRPRPISHTRALSFP